VEEVIILLNTQVLWPSAVRACIFKVAVQAKKKISHLYNSYLV
jgi:hypothetical protein